MASADRHIRLLFVVFCLLLLAGVVAGCNTTQDQNNRLGLRNQRTVESRTPVVVKQVNPDVDVVSAELLRGDEETAIAVTLRNTSDEILNDLPIVTGVRGSGGEKVLNSTIETPYFQGHTPVLEPGEDTTWVFTTKEDPGDGEAFARVGVAPPEPLVVAKSIPELDVSDELSTPKKGPATVHVELGNENTAPQYDLEVYAWAKRGDRIVAAGRGSIEHLGTGQNKELTLTMVGDVKGSEVQISAPPTFFE